jgi:hypothetical protein
MSSVVHIVGYTEARKMLLREIMPFVGKWCTVKHESGNTAVGIVSLDQREANDTVYVIVKEEDSVAWGFRLTTVTDVTELKNVATHESQANITLGELIDILTEMEELQKLIDKYLKSRPFISNVVQSLMVWQSLRGAQFRLNELRETPLDRAFVELVK